MSVPYHPMLVHFPIAGAILIPFLTLIFALFIRSKKMNLVSWSIIIFLNGAMVVSGYLSMETGEREEKIVKKVIDKKLIHEHEEMAEVFVAMNVITFSLSIALVLIPGLWGYRLRLALAAWGVVPLIFAFKTGELGGELVYKYGAARAYQEDLSTGILPTPGLNTSESDFPLPESE